MHLKKCRLHTNTHLNAQTKTDPMASVKINTLNAQNALHPMISVNIFAAALPKIICARKAKRALLESNAKHSKEFNQPYSVNKTEKEKKEQRNDNHSENSITIIESAEQDTNRKQLSHIKSKIKKKDDAKPYNLARRIQLIYIIEDIQDEIKEKKPGRNCYSYESRT